MKNKNRNRNTEPSIAPGMDDSEELEQAATEDEIDKGEYTEVTILSFDEVDPS
ncbi:hypothetical protein [Neobacillus vireti]|uniref:Uncharacterized protein n=1 Tax=Neobacillus vireti LMG 21834 TaxID=1131730 RepID=A0AB94IQP6_9BACI|nr:hypothetical protein [Neobacillus vireti]ETI69421.1 hypothetical protein BAVI_07571 [Neobacillus vireti LMG 21834]